MPKKTAQQAKQKKPAPPKSTAWNAPTIIGLVIGLVGLFGLISVWPQLTMTPLGQLANNQPFSAPFELSATGPIPVHVDHVIAVYHEVEYENGFKIQDSESGNKAWDDFDLNSAEGGTKTIGAYFSDGTPKTADIVFTVDYRVWGIKQKRAHFRFLGAHIDNWIWTKQPMGDLGPRIDERVEDALVKHAEANSH
jgi:hypothetical protein